MKAAKDPLRNRVSTIQKKEKIGLVTVQTAWTLDRWVMHLFRGEPKVALQWQQERELGVSKDSLLHLLLLAWLPRME